MGPQGRNEYVTNESQRTSAGRLKCEAIDMKMIFYSRAYKTHFYKKGFALLINLVLKVGVFGTREWPILTDNYYFSVLKRVEVVVSV